MKIMIDKHVLDVITDVFCDLLPVAIGFSLGACFAITVFFGGF